MSEQREYPALEPLIYRWRPRGGKLWIYDPTPEWIDDHRNEVDIEPLYGAAEIAGLRAQAVSFETYRETVISVSRVREDTVTSLRAKLESARKALENEREFWAGKVASAMIRKLPSSDAQDHVDRITAALTDEKST